jgi:hypothetical protein
MRYAFLIYCDESTKPGQGTADAEDCRRAYFALADEAKAMGIHLESAVLQPVATATTVRVRDGRPLTTDGPVAETKERLAGLYLLTCADLDEALDFAARIPAAKHGAVEVRPARPIEGDDTP